MAKSNNSINYNDIPKTLDNHIFYGLKLDEYQKKFRDAIWNPEKIAVVCNARAGSGKAQPVDTIIPTPIGYRRLGDIMPGDYVFNRFGMPVKVLNVFPQGQKEVYKVTLSDGRSTLCSKEHLWSYRPYRAPGFVTESLEEMMQRSTITNNRGCRYNIPNNFPVIYPTQSFDIDPYVIGVFLGDGCCLEYQLSLSSPDHDIVNEIARLLNVVPIKYCQSNYTWCFKETKSEQYHVLKTKDIFANYPELIQYSGNKRIPPIYLFGSIEQRISLLQGLLDTDGYISIAEGRYNVSFSTTSIGLMEDIKQLAYSLGISVSISEDSRYDKYKSNICYTIHFRVPNRLKPYLFRKCYHKLQRAIESTNFQKARDYDYNGIRSIENLHYSTEMVCLYVDDGEHLYLTNDFIVTHNTSIAVATANLLYQYGLYNGIVYIISPVMEQRQGFLPGGESEKNAPYMQPLIDALLTIGVDPSQAIISDDNIMSQKKGDAYIKFTADTFLRGINIENKVVIVEEAQNFYADLLKKTLTRIHDNCKVIIIGEDSQCDLVKNPERSGFVKYIKAFEEANDPRVEICELKKNYRGWFSSFCDDVKI